MNHAHVEKFSDGTMLITTGEDALELEWDSIVGFAEMFGQMALAGKQSEFDIYINGRGEVIEKKLEIVD